ncbi:hypothetical protein AUH73_07200 [archaeon 13_1_40CM_4_53_4]|nr:MAG: hypothetical protein AUH73_07200 [archaeon 13_1_40CM_4_53_4]
MNGLVMESVESSHLAKTSFRQGLVADRTLNPPLMVYLPNIAKHFLAQSDSDYQKKSGEKERIRLLGQLPKD